MLLVYAVLGEHRAAQVHDDDSIFPAIEGRKYATETIEAEGVS